MTVDDIHVRVLRLVAGAALVTGLVVGCGSDDSGTPVARQEPASSTPTPTEADDETSTTAPTEDTVEGGALLGGDPCAPIEAANLSEATGVDYTEQESDETQCTYASEGGSVVNVSATDITGTAGDIAFEAAQSVCDDNSASDISVDGADAAYKCTAMGASQLGAIHDNVMVLVTGADIMGEADESAFSDVLVAILENAVQA